ncbi:N4BP1 protein, partial [Amia calva]|nr:N4BP1 protein [Amia calva]
MSTTRPPVGVKAASGTAPCASPAHSYPAAAAKQQPGALNLDEFAVPEDKQEELKALQPRVELLFRVAFTIIGLLDPSGAHGSRASRQIWLQLKGRREDVAKAKEYVKGLCNPELQKKEGYPADMHCIFMWAQGLFLDCLIWDTSAEVSVEPGCLRILGGVEAVVMAQSQVQQFVKLFREKRSVPGDKEPAIKRTFKKFVEARDDNYTMELLLLPSSLKEALLTLAFTAGRQDSTDARLPTADPVVSQPEQDRAQASTPVSMLTEQILETTFEERVGTQDAAGKVHGCRQSCKRRSSGSEDRDTKRQFSLEGGCAEVGEPSDSCTVLLDDSGGSAAEVVVLDSSDNSDEAEVVSPETNFKCLVNFFMTMGYQQALVERVIHEMGQPEDAFVLLGRIVDESQRAQGSESQNDNSPHWDTLNQSPPREKSSTGSSKAREKAQSVNSVTGCNILTEWKSKENIQPSSNGLSIRAPGSGGSGQQGAIRKHRNGLLGSGEIITIEDDDLELDGMARAERNASTLSETDFLSRGSSQGFRPVRVESRFRQSLKTPYSLILQNEPGRPGLRHIIIDGSNVAMAHGLNHFFSCRGIAIAVESFWKRGHREITVFVPQWRLKRDPLTTEQHFLRQLEELRLLSFTPAREVCGKRIASHDDRFLLHLAERTGGVIVTNDNFKEFVSNSQAWMEIISERLLQFTFVEDYFMIPDDPLGKHGPRLEEFLCKDFRIPLTADRLGPRARVPSTGNVLAGPVPHLPIMPQLPPLLLWSQPGHLLRYPRPGPPAPPQRTVSETAELKHELYNIFPDHKQKIDQILSDNPYMRDPNALSGLLLG